MNSASSNEQLRTVNDRLQVELAERVRLQEERVQMQEEIIQAQNDRLFELSTARFSPGPAIASPTYPT